MEIDTITHLKIMNFYVPTVMLLLILIEERIAVFHKCVETIYQPPKRLAHGEDIVQTTTQ